MSADAAFFPAALPSEGLIDSPSTPLDPSESWSDDTIYTHDVVECTDIPHPSLFTEPDIYCHRSESDYDLDEDEDDLPPFDDWYTDIARRSTV